MGPQVWSRFETGDSGDAAWAAFSEYLHLAAPRISVSDFARGKKNPGDVLKWSLDWVWDARIAAYDEWASHAAMRKFYPVTHPAILQILRMCVSELKKYEEAQKKSGDALGLFTINDCLRMLKEVRAAERDIARLHKETEDAKAAGAVVHDFSRLSLAECRMLEELMAKVSQ